MLFNAQRSGSSVQQLNEEMNRILEERFHTFLQERDILKEDNEEMHL
jgi:hypothetical protein